MKKHFLIIFILLPFIAASQYAPPVGQPGSSAISKDSSVFVSWATGCSVSRGFQDISDPSLGYATAGDSSSALGIAGTTGIVSLGDAGSATLTFLYPIVNGPSWDFAVFENSFSDDFLELGFVEVSSDGINFFRFPASSLTDTAVQTASFGYTDATMINNLAGKYRALFGTPFDLQELSGTSGLDINDIKYVRVIDVVGSIQDQYASHDTAGRKVNDPWPTGFGSGGFDLDAVGVIHQNPSAGIRESALDNFFNLYPNPCAIAQPLTVIFNGDWNPSSELCIYNVQGIKVISERLDHIGTIDVSGLSKGVYFMEAMSASREIHRKKLIIN
jgi:hypothetical protein